MVKQPACAAAISSSGFVPFAFSNRVENEYGVLESTPLSLDIVPSPSLSDPFHTAEALRIIRPFLLGCSVAFYESKLVASIAD
jgi:hypothetical protein